MKRGEIWWVNFDSEKNTDIPKTRPAVIVSNDKANQFATRVQVLPATSNITKVYPFECLIDIQGKPSKVKADKIATVNKKRLMSKMGKINREELLAVNEILKTQLDLRD